MYDQTALMGESYMSFILKNQRMPFVKSAITLALACGFYQTAQADENNWYVDLGYQYSDISGTADDILATYDAKLGTIIGHIGYTLSPNFSIEGEFGLGIKEAKDIASFDPSINSLVPFPTFDLKQKYVVGLAARLQQDLGENVLVFARGGAAYSEYELTGTAFDGTVEQASDGELGALYGIGLEFRLNEQSGIRADLTRYEIGQFDNTSVSVGYSHRF